MSWRTARRGRGAGTTDWAAELLDPHRLSRRHTASWSTTCLVLPSLYGVPPSRLPPGSSVAPYRLDRDLRGAAGTAGLTRVIRVIFKRVGDQRPYPDHGYVQKQWAAIAPHQVRLDQLVTTKRTLDLEALLEEDSTFYGDLFAHVVSWRGEYYLEDGLHRALRAALQQRQTLHARVLELK